MCHSCSGYGVGRSCLLGMRSSSSIQKNADLSTPLLALYQGTTLVVPQRFETKLGFSPCILLIAGAKARIIFE
jgi:hypothetical protein